jgi:hypothetical protein
MDSSRAGPADGAERTAAERAAAERLLSAVRGAGLVFAVPAVATTPVFPGTAFAVVAWTLLAALAVGTLTIWLLTRFAVTLPCRTERVDTGARPSTSTTDTDIAEAGRRTGE